jgi:hypothetical protein
LGRRGRQQDQEAALPVLRLTLEECDAAAILGAHHGRMRADLLGPATEGLVTKGLAIMIPATVELTDRGAGFLRGKYPNHEIVFPEPSVPGGK